MKKYFRNGIGNIAQLEHKYKQNTCKNHNNQNVLLLVMSYSIHLNILEISLQRTLIVALLLLLSSAIKNINKVNKRTKFNIKKIGYRC